MSHLKSISLNVMAWLIGTSLPFLIIILFDTNPLGV